MISGLTQSEPERDPLAELEFHIDARHFGDDVRVGVAHAVNHLDAVDDVAGARGHKIGRGARCTSVGEGADSQVNLGQAIMKIVAEP
jgi:hypothetical protein